MEAVALSIPSSHEELNRTYFKRRLYSLNIHDGDEFDIDVPYSSQK